MRMNFLNLNHITTVTSTLKKYYTVLYLYVLPTRPMKQLCILARITQRFVRKGQPNIKFMLGQFIVWYSTVDGDYIH